MKTKEDILKEEIIEIIEWLILGYKHRLEDKTLSAKDIKKIQIALNKVIKEIKQLI